MDWKRGQPRESKGTRAAAAGRGRGREAAPAVANAEDEEQQPYATPTRPHQVFSIIFVRKSKKSFVYNAMWLWMVVIGFVNRNYEHIGVCRRPCATREERSAPPKSLGELRHWLHPGCIVFTVKRLTISQTTIILGRARPDGSVSCPMSLSS